MTRQRIYRFIFIVLISLGATSVQAKEKDKETNPLEQAPLFGGVAVGGDIVGFAMKAVNAKFANMEVCGRLNFKEKYFPICELGIGDCSRDGNNNDNTFKSTSPYFRVGMDYNFNKKVNGNRFFGGVRYGFSSYKYDFTSATFIDPVWQNASPINLKDLDGKNTWLELCVGLETKLWSIVRFGWNLRYKARLTQKAAPEGEPYFVPGFGKNNNVTFGGSVNLIFDIGKSARKNAGKETTLKTTLK